MAPSVPSLSIRAEATGTRTGTTTGGDAPSSSCPPPPPPPPFLASFSSSCSCCSSNSLSLSEEEPALRTRTLRRRSAAVEVEGEVEEVDEVDEKVDDDDAEKSLSAAAVDDADDALLASNASMAGSLLFFLSDWDILESGRCVGLHQACGKEEDARGLRTGRQGERSKRNDNRSEKRVVCSKPSFSLFFSRLRHPRVDIIAPPSSPLRFPPSPQQFMSAEEALAPTRRHQHILPDGRVAYEWSQSLNDVTVFVPCPAGVRGRDLDVCIERTRCRLGLKGNPPYLDVSAAFFLLRGGTLFLSLSLSSSGEKTTREKREKERRERKSERERESETTVETMRRAIETKTAKSLTPLQNLFFVTLHSTETAARDL